MLRPPDYRARDSSVADDGDPENPSLDMIDRISVALIDRIPVTLDDEGYLVAS